MAIAVRRSPIHASRFARVFFSDASALRLRVGIQIKPKRTRGETSGTVAERASRRGFARRGLPPVRACALCIGRRRRKPWEFIPFQSLRLANSKFGSGQANFGKKNHTLQFTSAPRPSRCMPLVFKNVQLSCSGHQTPTRPHISLSPSRSPSPRAPIVARLEVPHVVQGELRRGDPLG